MPYKYHILSQLNKYAGRDKVRLHMPGHKGRGEFARLFPQAKYDITELSFSDDLQDPSGAIAAAQSDIASIVGAKRAYITTDGSSSGVMACVYAASRIGKKLIVPRNSHKSVFNACRILGVEPVIVHGEEREGVLLPPDPDLISRLVAADVHIAGMIVTSPDYYGNIAPLDDYAAVLKPLGRYLFCDGAHGAHLFMEPDVYCGAHADMWVNGAHKTLPTLTQGAYVCVNDEDLFEYAEQSLAMFRTTSPSYPIMASVEYGVKFIANHPEIYYAASANVQKFLGEHSDFVFYPSDDWTKLAVDFKSLNISPALAQQKLEKRGIYAEMNDGRYLLFYLSPMTSARQLNKLGNALMGVVSSKKLRDTYREIGGVIPPAPRTYSYLYALGAPSEWVPVKDSIGAMCAENSGVTPPCIPVVVAGEIITPRAAKLLQSGKSTFGLRDGKIKVVRR